MITIIVGASLRIWIPSPGFIYLQTIWYQSYKVEAPVVAALHFLPAAVVGMIACVSFAPAKQAESP